jgi:hypothetical protein
MIYSVSSSSGIILIAGSLKTSLLAMLLSRDNNKEGSNNKLDSIANNKVVETNAPRATVPPKLEMVKTENPKNKTIDV